MRLPHLVKKLVFYQTDVTDEIIAALVRDCPNVEEIDLQYNPHVTEKGIREIAKWRNLKSVTIRNCPDILSIAALPFERLVECEICLGFPLEVDLLERLARSPVLKRVRCEISKKGLQVFKSAVSEDFEIDVRGCPQIDQDDIIVLNHEREPPIRVRMTHDDAPPLKEPPSEQGGRGTLIVPRNIDEPALMSLVDSAEEIHTAQLYDCLNVRYDGVTHFHIVDPQVLYLGKLPATARTVEKLFAQTEKVKRFQNLERLHLFELPVPDKALDYISRMPKLKTVSLFNCSVLTVAGLIDLVTQCPTLDSLSVHGCPLIDIFVREELRKIRKDEGLAELDLSFDRHVDETAVRFALEEMSRVVADKTINRFYYFLRTPVKHPWPIPEGARIGKYQLTRAEEVNKYYVKQLGLLRIKVDPKEDCWMEYDQTLQAYLNGVRGAGAVVAELVRQGYFSDTPPPRTVQGVLDLLGSQGVAKHVRRLILSRLWMTRLPSFLENSTWAGLEKVELEGNYFGELPFPFLHRHPKLFGLRPQPAQPS
ncbi:MAG TPA: hypothetical protein VLF94_08940 [Chlamydiales bacterium]|nr:hypothetical protein [Chlamydiales bacterium]